MKHFQSDCIQIMLLLVFLFSFLVGIEAKSQCSCYAYVQSYYSPQPYWLGNLNNITSCNNCTVNTCQKAFNQSLMVLEQFYDNQYPLYIYPSCIEEENPIKVTVEESMDEEFTAKVSSNLPNVHVNVHSDTNVDLKEHIYEQPYANWQYNGYYPNSYGYYTWPYSDYSYMDCQTSDCSEYTVITEQLQQIEDQVQQITRLLENMNQSTQIQDLKSNLSILYSQVEEFQVYTNNSLNFTQTFFEIFNGNSTENFTIVFEEMEQLKYNMSNMTTEVGYLKVNVTDLVTEEKKLDSNLTKLANKVDSHGATSTFSSNKVATSSSPTPTAIAGVVLGTISIVSVVVLVVLMVMRIII